MTMSEAIPEELNVLSGQIVDAAIRVHRELGPGLLESAYEACLVLELGSRGIRCERQVTVPISYRGQTVREGFRIDLLVGGEVVVELKAVDALTAVHEAQLLTYLKLTGRRVAS